MVGTALVLLLAVAIPPEPPGGGTPLADQVPLVVGSLAKSKELSWQLDKRMAAGEATTFSFVRDSQRLLVSVTPLATSEGAGSRLDALAMRVTATPTEVKGVGDRCLIWTNPRSGASTLIFQRGNAVFHLLAPSRDEALRVARTLDESLTP